TARRSDAATPGATRPAASTPPDRRAAAPPTRVRHATPTADRVAPPRADRKPAPAIEVLDARDARAPVPVADRVERHDADARPLIDALGRAFDVAPILMALALGGALCVVSRQRRRVG